MLIEALRYRSLLHVSQSLGSFQVLAGPNACGKSTFLDVPAFLGDMLNSDLSIAIRGSESLGIPLRASNPRHLTWQRKGTTFELAVEMAIPERLRLARAGRNGDYAVCRYEVAINVKGLPNFAVENLWLKPETKASLKRPRRSRFPQRFTPPKNIARLGRSRSPNGWKKLVSRGDDLKLITYRSETTDWRTTFRIEATKSALANLPEDEERFPVAVWFRDTLKGVTRIFLSSEAMRHPSPLAQANELLPDGSNLPYVVHALERHHSDHHRRWMEHIRELLPNVTNITTREREEDRRRFLVLRYDNGLEVTSQLVSDGTLRLMALTILAYIPNLSGTYLIEEPENGIHPHAIENVIQSLSSVYNAQILLTTHSPLVARLAKPDQLLCMALTERGATDMVTGDEHPRLKDWQGEADLGTLLAAGVLG